MDRYQRVEKKKPEAAISENEIRVTAQGRMRNYITYAMAKLEEEGPNEIVLKAMGRAINKTVMIAELIKRRIVGLHQNTSIESADITDTWEPLEEGLLTLETTRHVSVIVITLSKKELDTSSSGYQLPLPPDQVKRLVEYDQGEEFSPNVRGRGRGNRGRGTGRGRGYSNGLEDHGEYESWDAGRGYAGRGNVRGYRGRGRGRGRAYGGEIGGGRGRGYGGENGGGRGRGYGGDIGGGRGSRYAGENGGGYSRAEMHQESIEYEAPAPRGRGRGRGMVRGSGRGRNYRSNGSGPAQANA